MTADVRAEIEAAVLLSGPIHDTALAVDALELLVERLATERVAAVVDQVQAVYDLQCPVRPASDYMDRGAYYAHTWWQTVLGGTLERLRDRIKVTS